MKRTLTLTIIILTLGTTLMACNRATTAPDSTPWDGIARGLQVIDHAPDQPGVKTRTITLTWLPNKPSETYNTAVKDPDFPDVTFVHRKIKDTTHSPTGLSEGKRYGFAVSGGTDWHDDPSNYIFHTAGNPPPPTETNIKSQSRP